MQNTDIDQHKSAPPAILFICKKARVSEASARLIATLNGMALPDEWLDVAEDATRMVPSKREIRQ